MERPAARIFGGNEPTPIPFPIDPESLDATRPVDLDVCTGCAGDGLVVVLLESDLVDRDCPRCGGTGERSLW